MIRETPTPNSKDSSIHSTSDLRAYNYRQFRAPQQIMLETSAAWLVDRGLVRPGIGAHAHAAFPYRRLGWRFRKSPTTLWPLTRGPGSRVSIPDAARLVEAVLEKSTGKDSLLRQSHWRRVAAAGLSLLPETLGVDPALVFLFALFHDSMRLNDNYDPEHGPRAAL